MCVRTWNRCYEQSIVRHVYWLAGSVLWWALTVWSWVVCGCPLLSHIRWTASYSDFQECYLFRMYIILWNQSWEVCWWGAAVVVAVMMNCLSRTDVLAFVMFRTEFCCGFLKSSTPLWTFFPLWVSSSNPGDTEWSFLITQSSVVVCKERVSPFVRLLVWIECLSLDLLQPSGPLLVRPSEDILCLMMETLLILMMRKAYQY